MKFIYFFIVIYLYVKLPLFHMILEKMVLDGGLDAGGEFLGILGIPSGGDGGYGCAVVLGGVATAVGFGFGYAAGSLAKTFS